MFTEAIVVSTGYSNIMSYIRRHYNVDDTQTEISKYLTQNIHLLT